MSLLERQLENKTLSNAYIIESEDLAYNLAYAKDFSKKVFRSFNVSDNIYNNPDFELIDKDTIDIGTVRNLLKDLVIRPINNKIKIYIINNAQNMRIEAANAMLKSLEELKFYSLLIFTTDNKGKMLETIRSRCQVISLDSKNSNLDIDVERLLEIFTEVYEGDLSTFYKEKDFLNSFKEEKNNLVAGLIKILSDILSYKYLDIDDTTSYYYNIERLKAMKLDQIERLLNKIEKISKSYKNNINYELSVENIFFNIYKEGRNGKWM